MNALTKLNKKIREISTESRQRFSSLLNRNSFTLHQGDLSIIDDLHKNGIHVTTIEQLFPDTANKLTEVFANVAVAMDISKDCELPDYVQKKTSSYDMLPGVLLSKYPEIFFLGLSKRLLDIVEAYLELPAAYHGVVIRRSLADGLECGPRLWHKDDEDFHVVRVVIYLNDVDVGGGPFEYIPRPYKVSKKAMESIGWKTTTENMQKIVPQEVVRQCYGKAGTVIICDAANTYHHEQMQISQPRSVAMFGFSTRLPKNLSLAKSHFLVENVRDQLHPLLAASQVPYVYGWRD